MILKLNVKNGIYYFLKIQECLRLDFNLVSYIQFSFSLLTLKARSQVSYGFLQKELSKYRRLFRLCFVTKS